MTDYSHGCETIENIHKMPGSAWDTGNDQKVNVSPALLLQGSSDGLFLSL